MHGVRRVRLLGAWGEEGEVARCMGEEGEVARCMG